MQALAQLGREYALVQGGLENLENATSSKVNNCCFDLDAVSKEIENVRVGILPRENLGEVESLQKEINGLTELLSQKADEFEKEKARIKSDHEAEIKRLRGDPGKRQFYIGDKVRINGHIFKKRKNLNGKIAIVLGQVPSGRYTVQLEETDDLISLSSETLSLEKREDSESGEEDSSSDSFQNDVYDIFQAKQDIKEIKSSLEEAKTSCSSIMNYVNSVGLFHSHYKIPQMEVLCNNISSALDQSIPKLEKFTNLIQNPVFDEDQVKNSGKNGSDSDEKSGDVEQEKICELDLARSLLLDCEETLQKTQDELKAANAEIEKQKKEHESRIVELESNTKMLETDFQNLRLDYSLKMEKCARLEADLKSMHSEFLLGDPKFDHLTCSELQTISDNLQRIQLKAIDVMAKIRSYIVAKNEDQSLCGICCAEKKTTAIVPCGHVCCHKCVRRLQNCPYCRGRKRGIMKLHL